MTTLTELQRDILGLIRDLEGNLQPEAARLGLTSVDKALDRAAAALRDASDMLNDLRKDPAIRRMAEAGGRR